jgi:hypothetical protein
MEKATIIGIDLAKRVFQLHGVTSDGRAAFRKRVSRSQLLSLLAEQPGAHPTRAASSSQAKSVACSASSSASSDDDPPSNPSSAI